MKLAELMTRDAVTDVLSATPSSHFSEVKGHILDLDQGLVRISAEGKPGVRLVPLTNVKFMTPASVPPKGK